ncbi:MAG: hypothetical protein JO272_09830 [Pseudonocardiales bacterium]|nr:hypothetical protein [Pseudonocardiales bacterium]
MEPSGAQRGPRAVFAERFAVLYAEAGDPPLRQVTATVARSGAVDESGRAVRVSVQRVSDWRAGRNVPARFAVLAAVLMVLIAQARKIRPDPCLEGLYDVPAWRRLWEQALASPVAPADSQLGTPESGDTGVCPYKGLAAFSQQDAGWFFGREHSTATLVARLGEALDSGGIVMLVGASGAGKSSLLNAGLLPALAQGELGMGSESWPVLTMSPGTDPVKELVRNIPELTETLDTAGDQFASGVRAACASHLAHTAGENTRLVIVVDQFEETFTLSGNEQRRRLFVRMLEAASRPEDPGGMAPALVVVGLRADFYSQCLDYPELARALQNRQMVLGPMTTQELRAAITRPAQAEDLTLQPGLVELLLRDLGVTEDTAAQAAGDDPGALPLLAHALRATWHHRERQTLTVAGYRRTGGIRQALATTAEHAYTQLSPIEQPIARQVLLRLVNVSDQGGSADTRRRLPRAQLIEALPDSAPAVEAALEAFGGARLLTFDTTSVEITHEALLRAWPRLRHWIDTDRAGNLTRQDLEHAATRWDRDGRDSAALYRGARLETARAWIASQPNKGDLSPAASAFLTASTTQQRRSAQLRRTVLAALCVLALLTSGTAALAIYQRTTAQQQRDTAILNQIIARADRLRGTDISLAAQLDLTAYRRRPTQDLYTALITDANAALSTPLSGHTDSVNAVAFSPDGRTLASGSSDHTIRLWNMADPTHPTPLGSSLSGHTDSVKAIAFNPDGRTLASGSSDHTIRLWNVTDPAHPTPLGSPLTTQTDQIAAVVFSPDGRILATGSGDQTVLLWNVTNPTHPTPVEPPLTGHNSYVGAVAFSPDGHTLASGSWDQTMRLWNIPSVFLISHTGPVHAVVFIPDGRILATGSYDRTVQLWSVVDSVHPAAVGPPLSGHTGNVNAVAFSPDGHTLASGSDDHTIRLWSVADSAHPAAVGPPLSGHTGNVNAVAFSPDGRTLASGSDDHTVRLWNITDLTHPTPVGKPLTGHTNTVFAVAFSPDGRTLASGSDDQTVRLWNVTDPNHAMPLGAPLNGHTNTVRSVAFSPDGHRLASGSDDRTIRLWNVADPAHATALGQPLTGDTRFVSAVALSPDGHTLASGSRDRTVRLWDLNVDQAIQRICATTANTLTPATWAQYVSPDLPYRPPCS